ncbi:uncharacterized protein LOC131885916 [Tigriopus californicus]|nr:uncharacterized protein LOC131885916 [Tigriopus californicus]XP_059090104.1 uncharacterized protein LOC131885916 [Tigriopus californicus]
MTPEMPVLIKKNVSSTNVYCVAIVILLLYHLGFLSPLTANLIQSEANGRASTHCSKVATPDFASLSDEPVFVNQSTRVPLCQCQIQLPQVYSTHSSFEDTTCSATAFARGDHQRVVGFSFYGDSRSPKHKSKQYYQGIIDNLGLMNKFYPGWIMRLYFDLNLGDDLLGSLCELSCQNANLDLCHIQHLPGTPLPNASRIFPMNWRFFPTLDPQVDLFVSRDLDSRFSDREQSAVQEWLNSKWAFHMMRDHPAHVVSILGSGWGVKLTSTEIRSQWKSAWMIGKNSPIMWATRGMTGPDQGFLKRFVWPWAKKDSIQHDSYTCQVFPGTLGFPTPRKNEPDNFIASVVAQNMSIWKICPYQCRREGHRLDWIYC